ncbi:MAG TPA: 5'-methylthioadenosine/adenosylhomocysteine nucleosidase [Geminicoccus sp.]|uniref:5'-methylthioadenosine/adenosylhomocysteine nucleosidase n=1 Tax=Geminicoccus sp. TaxID=2024832 RepID=UPI002E3197EC|nr:5'-methylthioadenosine/adenosylhomocysteine nucleosidase [Geminicoccus sp.]HEX2527189.1 5'-methylthioadenosine/adenosylhomocysteine nucleosidase [Geminicoccus sp.]
MTIGLICAIPQELAHLRQALVAHDVTEVAGLRFDHGRLDGHDVILVGAGIGKVNTALTATLLCDRFGCRLIMFSGVAGGLDPALQIGDVVVADRTIQHDAGVIENGTVQTYQAGHVPFFNPTDRLGYPVDPALLAKVKAALQDVRLGHVTAAGSGRAAEIGYGTILSGDQYLHCEATRERLFRELGGRAIEMEGGALGQVCEAFGTPWLDIRALSDLAGTDSRFDFARFVDEVAASSAAILRRLLQAV